MRRLVLCALAGWIAAGALEAAQPKLILAVSVDQMRYDYLTRFAPLYKGGFKRLLDRGAVFSNATYRHAATETGPGHSVILSGRHASSSGIVANDWWDPLLKRTVNVVEDPAQNTVGGPGRAASPVNFVSFHLGDKIKQKWPESRVVGISMKDRAAILMTGHRADAAFWFETGCACFITSTYYTNEAPAWLTAFNRLKLPDSFAKKSWTRLLPDQAVYEQYAGKDDQPGEADLKDIVFPHAFRNNPPEPPYYTALTRTPFSDEMLLAAATEIMGAYRLGAGNSPDLLAVSFSAPDAIGHYYGVHSQEAMDEFLRLDGILQKLFDLAEQRVGAENLLVVLAGDHGATPTVEWLQTHDKPAQRYSSGIISDAVRSIVSERWPLAGELIASLATPDVYFDLEAIDKAGIKRADVEGAVIDALMSTGLVEHVYTQAELTMAPRGRDPYIDFFRNSYFSPRAPHLTTLLKRYVYLTMSAAGGGHGTAYEDDRHVPIVFMGPGIPKGSYSAPAGPEDIAPTLAKMLDIPYPLEWDSRLLTEILPPAPAAAPARGGRGTATSGGAEAR
jgi:predicted AlkP superfamily pyrophosphatase or phosphodiesterase